MTRRRCKTCGRRTQWRVLVHGKRWRCKRCGEVSTMTRFGPYRARGMEASGSRAGSNPVSPGSSPGSLAP